MTLSSSIEHRLVQALCAGGVGLENTLSEVFAAFGLTPPFIRATGPATRAAVKRFTAEANWLIAAAAKTDPGVVARNFVTFLEENRVRVQRICAFWGMNPQTPVQVNDYLRIVPIAALPASAAQDYFRDIPASPPAAPFAPRPGAAIVYEKDLVPIYFAPNQAGPAFDWDDKYFLADLVALSSILASGPTVPVGEWTHIPESTPVIGNQSGWAMSLTDARVLQAIPACEYDRSLAVRVFGGYVGLEPDVRQRLMVAVRRLNQAWLREAISDIAIDVGVAIEALLTESSDLNDGITHRLRVRAARLLGGSASDRDAVAEQVTRIYALRSRAAHGVDIDRRASTGKPIKLGTGKKLFEQDLYHLLNEGRLLCARIALHILDSGSFPSYRRLDIGED